MEDFQTSCPLNKQWLLSFFRNLFYFFHLFYLFPLVYFCIKSIKIPFLSTVCSSPAHIVFAVESRHSQSEFDEQLTFIQHIIKSFQISPDNVRVALITYGNEVHLQFGFHDFKDSSNLLKGVASIMNDFKESSEVQFAKLYETALITFDAEGRTSTPLSRALIVFTFAKNATQNDSMHNLVSSAGNKGILMSVVAMRNTSKEEDFPSLVEDKQNVFTEGTTNITNDVPWIVDLICHGKTVYRQDQRCTTCIYLSLYIYIYISKSMLIILRNNAKRYFSSLNHLIGPTARKSDISSTNVSLVPSTLEVVTSSSSSNVTSLYWHTPSLFGTKTNTLFPNPLKEG